MPVTEEVDVNNPVKIKTKLKYDFLSYKKISLPIYTLNIMKGFWIQILKHMESKIRIAIHQVWK